MSMVVWNRIQVRTEAADAPGHAALLRSMDRTPAASTKLMPVAALRLAWWAWSVCMLGPSILFLAMVWHFACTSEQPGDTLLADRWFIFSTAFMVAAVPGALFWRSHLFKPYWDGHRVGPWAWLAGSIILWVSLALAGILSMVGCLISHSLLPNLFPALVAFILYASLWPTGTPMVRASQGNLDDPQLYEEPR